MRQRGAEFRRSGRRRLQDAVWWTTGSFLILFFIYILTKGTTNIDSTDQFSRRNFRHDEVIEGFHVTDEMLSPDSVARQINDQISIAKAFVVIAKESNNQQFAWELSAQIRISQIFLSSF